MCQTSNATDQLFGYRRNDRRSRAQNPVAVTVKDHGLVGLYYALTLLWTLMSKMFMARRDQPYELGNQATANWTGHIYRHAKKIQSLLGDRGTYLDPWMDSFVLAIAGASQRAFEDVDRALAARTEDEELKHTAVLEERATRTRGGREDEHYPFAEWENPLEAEAENEAGRSDEESADGAAAPSAVRRGPKLDPVATGSYERWRAAGAKPTETPNAWRGFRAGPVRFAKGVAGGKKYPRDAPLLKSEMDRVALTPAELDKYFSSVTEYQQGNNVLSVLLARCLHWFGRTKCWASSFLLPAKSHGAHLKTLSLTGCMIQDAGAAVVADVLTSRGCAIETLDLGLNFIGPKGLAALGDALDANWTLKNLSLEGNQVDDDAAEAFILKVVAQQGQGLAALLISDMRQMRGYELAAPEDVVFRTFDVVPEAAAALLELGVTLWCHPGGIRTPPPRVIFESGGGRDEGGCREVSLKELRDYYERLQDAAGVNRTLKLLLVGLGTAGKTSMANRLRGVKCADTGTYCTALETRTIGIDIAHWEAAEDVSFKIWDFAGQDSYGLTHQFFLSEFALNVICVDVNRYALGDDAEGKADVVAYLLEQELGHDIRAQLPKIKEPIVESDRIYREAFLAVSRDEPDAAVALLALPDAQAHGGVLLDAADARKARAPPDANLHTHRDVEGVFKAARQAQRALKETLAPGTDWAKADKGEQVDAGLSCVDILNVFDPGVKSRDRVREKAVFKYNGRYERVRDVARLAVVCDRLGKLRGRTRVM